jgi:hypothetical protein
MTAQAALREALRNIVCACFAYGLVLQLVLGALVSGAHASTPISSLENRGVICTSAGATTAPLDPAASDHHQTAGDCCALGCATPAPTLPAPAQIPSDILALERTTHTAVPLPVDATFRGPSARSVPQSPRAPPLTS